MKAIKERTAELDDYEAQLKSGTTMVEQLMNADKQRLNGNADQAYALYTSANNYALNLGLSKVMEYIKDQLTNQMRYDPKQYDSAMQKGLSLLDNPTPDLTEAAAAFVMALNNKPKDQDALKYTAYINDLKYCDRAGQALYSGMRPSLANRKQFNWSGDERNSAFCIDRYEHPNIAGQLPMVDVPFIVAMQECEKMGKKLCTPLRWTDACKGANVANQFPYGNGKDVDASACNVEGSGLLPSGSKSACKNSIGAFDMSGNAAEWTAEAGADGPVSVIKGGSFRDKATAQDSGCSAEFNAEKGDFKANFVGFRCCRDLEKK